MEEEINNDATTKRDYNHILCHLLDDASRMHKDANLDIGLAVLLINIEEH